MRIIIVTDAWAPQVNGVVRTLTNTVSELKAMYHDVEVIEPSMYKTFPCPFYPEIPYTYGINDMHERIPYRCAVHIATEGPLGLAYSDFCRKNKIWFTTSYTTNYPEYLNHYLWVPKSWSYAYLKWFHNRSSGTMVSTPHLQQRLEWKGFKNLKRWSRGVNTHLFKPRETPQQNGYMTLLYVGRVAAEKNLEAFLDIPDHVKLVVGDGPALKSLEKKYPKAIFAGALHGTRLADKYRLADCFVFPSKTDTFGVVLLEALASGVPIAAYPVEGPIDIWDGDIKTGFLHEDLSVAVENALMHGRSAYCRELALKYTWRECTKQFVSNLIENK